MPIREVVPKTIHASVRNDGRVLEALGVCEFTAINSGDAVSVTANSEKRPSTFNLSPAHLR